MKYQLKACGRCRGDLYWEPVDKAWTCLQCGQRYYTEAPVPYGYGRNTAQDEKRYVKTKA